MRGVVMQTIKETYRQTMIGQLQLWDSQISSIKNGIIRQDPASRLVAIRRYQELERYHRDVFLRFEDLLLANAVEWDSKMSVLDTSAEALRLELATFTMQPA